MKVKHLDTKFACVNKQDKPVSNSVCDKFLKSIFYHRLGCTEESVNVVGTEAKGCAVISSKPVTVTFEDVLDTATYTRQCAIKSGLCDKVDGKVSWNIAPQSTGVAEAIRQGREKLADLIEKGLNRCCTETCKGPAVSRCLDKIRPQKVPSPLDAELQRVVVSMEACPARMKGCAGLNYDPRDGTGVEFTATLPYIARTWMGLKATVSMNDFRTLKIPNFALSMTRPLLIRKKCGRGSLMVLESFAHRKALPITHLQQLVRENVLSAGLRVTDPSKEEMTVEVRLDKVACESLPSNGTEVDLLNICTNKAASFLNLSLEKRSEGECKVGGRMKCSRGAYFDLPVDSGEPNPLNGLLSSFWTRLSTHRTVLDVINLNSEYHVRGVMRGLADGDFTAKDLPLSKRFFMGSGRVFGAPLRAAPQGGVAGLGVPLATPPERKVCCSLTGWWKKPSSPKAPDYSPECQSESESAAGEGVHCILPRASDRKHSAIKTYRLGGVFNIQASHEASLKSLLALPLVDRLTRRRETIRALATETAPFVFVDKGILLERWNQLKDINAVMNNTFVSAGAGLKMRPMGGLTLEATLGTPLLTAENVSPCGFNFRAIYDEDI